MEGEKGEEEDIERGGKRRRELKGCPTVFKFIIPPRGREQEMEGPAHHLQLATP